MVGMVEITSALTSLKVAKDIAETMIGVRDASAFQEKRIELQSKIIDAQVSVFAAQEAGATLIETIRELKEKLVNMETWETEKQRYHLQAVDGVSFVYGLKASMAGGEPPHWLCANCYTQNKKAVLQVATKHLGGMGDRGWQCLRCQNALIMRGTTTPAELYEGNNASP